MCVRRAPSPMPSPLGGTGTGVPGPGPAPVPVRYRSVLWCRRGPPPRTRQTCCSIRIRIPTRRPRDPPPHPENRIDEKNSARGRFEIEKIDKQKEKIPAMANDYTQDMIDEWLNHGAHTAGQSLRAKGSVPRRVRRRFYYYKGEGKIYVESISNLAESMALPRKRMVTRKAMQLGRVRKWIVD